MTLRTVVWLIAFAFAPTAMAADSEDRTYPQDDVPACMQRDDDGAAIRCILRGSRVREQMIRPNLDETTEPAGSPATAPDELPVSSMAIAN